MNPNVQSGGDIFTRCVIIRCVHACFCRTWWVEWRIDPVEYTTRYLVDDSHVLNKVIELTPKYISGISPLRRHQNRARIYCCIGGLP